MKTSDSCDDAFGRNVNSTATTRHLAVASCKLARCQIYKID